MNADIARLLLETGSVELRPGNPFRFASGILSPIYCDNRLLLSHVEGRKQVVKAFCRNVRSSQPKQIAGVATAGIAWGAWVADELNLPLVYVRSSAKEHGKKNQIEGKVVPGAETVVIEDLVSTGGSVLNAVMELEKAGAVVKSVCAIFTYDFSEARDAFAQCSLPLKTAVTLEDLLTVGIELKKISNVESDAIRAWQKNPRK